MINYNQIILFSITCIIVLCFQTYVLDDMMPIHNFVNVHIYWFPLLLLPIRIPIHTVACIAISLGLFLDLMYDSFGLFMLGGLWVGCSRDVLLSYFFSDRKINLFKEKPLNVVMESRTFFVYILLLSGVHSFVTILLESFSLIISYHLMLRWVMNTVYSAISIYLLQLIYLNIKQKKREKEYTIS